MDLIDTFRKGSQQLNDAQIGQHHLVLVEGVSILHVPYSYTSGSPVFGGGGGGREYPPGKFYYLFPQKLLPLQMFLNPAQEAKTYRSHDYHILDIQWNKSMQQN